MHDAHFLRYKVSLLVAQTYSHHPPHSRSPHSHSPHTHSPHTRSPHSHSPHSGFPQDSVVALVITSIII